MNKIIAGLLVYLLAIGQVFGQTATLVPNAKQTFLGTTGAPLGAGSVTMYVPGSTNKKTTWLDAYQASNNTNPVVLDAAGRAVIFGQGNYRQVVKDKNGVTIWDGFTSAVGSAAPSGATGTDTAPVGTVVPYSGFSIPINWQLAYGQAVSRTTFSDLKTAITIVDTAISCTNGSATLTGFVSTAMVRVGSPIEGSCFTTGVTVASIVSATSITISAMASSTATTTTTVFPWGNGDGVATFNVPDLRGRVPSGPDSMGGSAANRLQTTSTITTVSGNATASVPLADAISSGMTVVSANVPASATITALNTDVSTTVSTTNLSTAATVTSAAGLIVGMVITSANIPAAATISAISGTSVTLSSAANATASGTAARFTTGVTNLSVTLSGAATSTASATTAVFQNIASANSPAASGGTANKTLALSEAPSHSHVATVTDPGHTHIQRYAATGGGGLNGITLNAGAATFANSESPTASSVTGITVGNANTGGSRPFALVQPTVTVNYIIKMAANTTGAGGVVSLGGMFGDIVCDTTFNCSAQGSPSVNTIGLASQANLTMLANISGVAAQPFSATNTQWLDATCGSSQGMIIYRGSSSWNCLSAGINGQALALTGGLPAWTNLAGTGTVQSVALSAPSIFTVTGSPITATGTLGFDLTSPSNGGIIYSTATTLGLLSGTATARQILQSGSSNAPAWSTATYPATTAAGTINVSATANTITASSSPTLGIPGTTAGGMAFAGATSGTVSIITQSSALTPTLTLPTNTGTFAVSATTPIVVNSSTGNITCPTCATSSGGGAITGTAPVAVSAAGVVSITGLAGGVLAGSSPAFTTTPTLGASGTLGTISFGNATSGTITLSPVAGVLGSATITLPAATDTMAVLAASQALTNKSYNGLTLTATTGTFTLANAKTLSVTNSLTLSGTDSTTMTFPSVSATIPRVVASGAKALATTAISSAACTAAQTDTATGTLTTDAISASFNGDPTGVTGYVPLTSGMLTIIVYPTADTINFKVCNNTLSSVTPGAITLNWRVVR